ncbi:hypothetical protein JHK87_028009 [Glycine soja]|nr:hypothetical protein JHK87_028009 [Glycine soja]
MSSRTSDMDDFHKGLCGWSWKENKLFELALAVVDENHLKRWEVVAAMIGGQKSAGDVQEHYVFLLEDLNSLSLENWTINLLSSSMSFQQNKTRLTCDIL